VGGVEIHHALKRLPGNVFVKAERLGLVRLPSRKRRDVFEFRHPSFHLPTFKGRASIISRAVDHHDMPSPSGCIATSSLSAPLSE
jgi:hypothetical protein